MNKPSQDEFDYILDLFDNHNKKTRPERRAAVNYLWDAIPNAMLPPNDANESPKCY